MFQELVWKRVKNNLNWNGNKLITFESETNLLNNDDVGIGIDPGRNCGIGVVQGNKITAHYIRLPRGSMQLVAFSFIMEMEHILFPNMRNCSVAIEGASYNDIYGQVKLESIRSGLILGLHTCGYKSINVFAPKSARKFVFGNGKIRASEVWLINPNAADAACLAIAAAKGLTLA